MQETWVQLLGWEDLLEKGNDYPPQYSCLVNSTDRGAWQATVHRLQRVRHDWATNAFTLFPVKQRGCGGQRWWTRERKQMCPSSWKQRVWLPSCLISPGLSALTSVSLLGWASHSLIPPLPPFPLSLVYAVPRELLTPRGLFRALLEL